MAKVASLDVDAARVSRTSDGAVVFDDPESAWVVRIWTRTRARGRPVVSRIQVTARNGQDSGISASQLARLPVTQMLHIATTESAAVKDHPNEVLYRKQAVPKAPGQRSWDEDHWRRVLIVYEWAKSSRRKGGATQAIADMWSVARKPTAERWRAEARQQGDKDRKARANAAPASPP